MAGRGQKEGEIIMTKTYFQGHPAIYDYNKKRWVYEDNGEQVDISLRPCKKCGKLPEQGRKDSCIFPIIEALNKGGIKTIYSCCGHGSNLGYIKLKDGRIFIIARNDEDFVMIKRGFYDRSKKEE